MWTCKKCGEGIEGQFDACWKCSQPIDPDSASQSTKQHPKVFQRTEATIVDVKIPLWSLVILLLKLAIAAIPAAIIMIAIYLGAIVVLGGLFGDFSVI